MINSQVESKAVSVRKMSLILKTVLLLGFLSGTTFGAREVFNIAHMTNTPAAVKWAVSQGANGVEADLTFNKYTGKPEQFYHGPPCDCTCVCLFGCPSDSVCDILEETSKSCSTKVPVSELLSTMAQSELAVIVIDSKNIDDMDEPTMGDAGKAVVDVLTTHLFNNGYGGQVVIGSSYENTLPYLKSAVDALSNTPYADRVFYTLDMLDVDTALLALHKLPTKNFIYGTGKSKCARIKFDNDNLQKAVMNTIEGTVRLTYIWTVDDDEEMKDYMPYVSAIMTNYPATAKKVILESGLRLATKNSHIPPATSSNVITSVPSCECHYYKGGCIIYEPAPEGAACYCWYASFWTCTQTLAQCMDPGSRYCKHPDTSEESCRQGMGDCGAY